MRYFVFVLSFVAACGTTGVGLHNDNQDGGTEDASVLPDSVVPDDSAPDSVVPPTCGNGSIDTGEQCDGQNLGIATCEIIGNYVGGVLGCTDACTFDTTACEPPANCGNGTIDSGEQCDGLNLNQQDCTTAGNYVGGVLTCAGDCTFNTTACTTSTAVCGNSVVEPGEDCDRAQLAGATCETAGNFVGGVLACAGDCTFDTSACTPPPDCGNYVIDPGEQCDDFNLNLANCTSLGYYGGVLACRPDCTYDESGCTMCGNGVINVGEQCDGAALNQQDCQSRGYTSGTLTCAADCTFDESQCDMDGFTMISAGHGNSCAVKPDGTAYCWGKLNGVTLGNVPALVQGVAGVATISTGRFSFVCVGKTDGTVWCWGNNEAGQLGDGTFVNSTTLVQVLNLTNVVKVSAGSTHACAVKANGTAWCWGEGTSGQLGNGAIVDSNVPVQVSGLTNVNDIVAGYNHACAVKTDGTVWCWGGNNSGRLGDGTTVVYSSVPVQASILGVVSISASTTHVCAVKTDGTVWCWGNNLYGAIGDGTVVDRPLPTQTLNLTSVVSVTAGTSFSCARQSNGTAWCWGVNNLRQLGDGVANHQMCGSGGDCSPVPVTVVNIANVMVIDAGYQHSCAVLTNRTAWCWGINTYGQLGDGSVLGSVVPVAVQMP